MLYLQLHNSLFDQFIAYIIPVGIPHTIVKYKNGGNIEIMDHRNDGKIKYMELNTIKNIGFHNSITKTTCMQYKKNK